MASRVVRHRLATGPLQEPGSGRGLGWMCAGSWGVCVCQCVICPPPRVPTPTGVGRDVRFGFFLLTDFGVVMTHRVRTLYK